MAGLKRRILGITVISVGVCAALPFRYQAVNAPDDTCEVPAASTSRNELTLQLTIPAAMAAAPATEISPRPVSSVATTKPTPPHEVRREELQTPPSIASTFEPLVAAPRVATSPVATFPVATTKPVLTTGRGQPAQRHRISDGDTLEALAERYLGDRDRWPSIWEANDGLLRDPSILPIGLEIRIPQFRQPSRDDADTHLVPIPPGLLRREAR